MLWKYYYSISIISAVGLIVLLSLMTTSVISQSNKTNSVSRNSHDITYNSKFECGSIVGDKGPLRPGHYDTDISIFNRQDYPIEILWNSIVNDGKITNQTIKTMLPQTSIGITCKDIRQDLSIGNNSKELVEGFVVIRAKPNAGVLGSLSSNASRPGTEGRLNMDQINLLDVQVFYTANALESLPHELVNSNIVFSILNDTTSKIPSSLLMKPLHISSPSQLNQISDPETQVKDILSQKYNLSTQEEAGLRVKIIDVTVGVAAMIDDHAISTTILTPHSST